MSQTNAGQSEVRALEAPLGQLEQTLIKEFVRARGYDPAELANLPKAVREKLLRDASAYASARMAEVESRSRFVHEIHHVGPSVSKTGRE